MANGQVLWTWRNQSLDIAGGVVKRKAIYGLVTVSLYDPASPLLEIPPREIKTRPHENLCSSDCVQTLAIAALFTGTPRRKQPKCPSTDEWIHKMWSSHAMDGTTIRWNIMGCCCLGNKFTVRMRAKGRNLGSSSTENL
jgi:hypothetical protein